MDREEKREIVAESLRPGVRPSETIQRHGITSGQLCAWRQQLTRRVGGELARPGDQAQPAPSFARVDVVLRQSQRRQQPAAEMPLARPSVQVPLSTVSRMRGGIGIGVVAKLPREDRRYTGLEQNLPVQRETAHLVGGGGHGSAAASGCRCRSGRAAMPETVGDPLLQRGEAKIRATHHRSHARAVEEMRVALRGEHAGGFAIALGAMAVGSARYQAAGDHRNRADLTEYIFFGCFLNPTGGGPIGPRSGSCAGRRLNCEHGWTSAYTARHRRIGGNRAATLAALRQARDGPVSPTR